MKEKQMDLNPSQSLQPPLASDKRERAGRPLPPLYHAALHSVQRPPGKGSWKKPDQPAPPKVYRVDPRGFRQLVQQLTGAASLAPPRPLSDMVPQPPPLQMVAPAMSVAQLQFAQPAVGGGGDQTKGDSSGIQSPTTSFMQGLLSPSPYSSWCSFPLLSPVGSMEHL